MPITSGQSDVGFSTINTELGRTSNAANTSLAGLCKGTYVTLNSNSPTKPDGTGEHSVGEFRGYNHSASASLTAWYGSATYGSGFEACNDTRTKSTYYHDGAGSTPVAGDYVFTDSQGQNKVGTGQAIKIYGVAAYVGISTSTDGLVQSISSCGRSERRLKYNIEFIGNSPMGIPMYHFDYKDKSHGDGRFIGTMVEDLQRLGFEDALFTMNGEVWVDYGKIDVPYHSI